MPKEDMPYDKNGEPSIKPDYSAPVGITAESVLNKYIEAIGGIDNVA